MSDSYDSVRKVWRGPTRDSVLNPKAGIGWIVLNLFRQNPDRVMQISDDSGVEVTCGEMFSRTAKICTFLSDKTDLKRGDVVGIIARNSQNVAPLAFACFTLALPISPFAHVMGVAEIVEMYARTKPKAIFCDWDVVERVKRAIEEIPLVNCKIYTLMRKVEGFEFLDDILGSFEGNFEDFE